MDVMSHVVFMCGPAGSGKSTFACRLEDVGFVRLSIDEEAWARGHRSQPLPDNVAWEVENALRTRLISLIKHGSNVVLDYSFSSLALREDYRQLLAPLGVVPETIYLATPRDVALRRIKDRDGTDANEARLTEEMAASYFDGFEPPTTGEGPLQVIR